MSNIYMHPVPSNSYHHVMGNHHYMPYAFPAHVSPISPVPPVASLPVSAVTDSYHGNVTINNYNGNVLTVRNPYKKHQEKRGFYGSETSEGRP